MMKQIIFALLFLGVAVSAKVSREEIVDVTNSLKAAIQLDNQCATSADCITAPVGARACGGPSSYVVYSAKSYNAKDIVLLAQLSTKLEKQYNMENSVMSICSMAMAPRAVCNANKCAAAGSSLPFESVL